MSSKIKVDTIENVAGSGNVSLGSGHNLVVPGNITGQGTTTLTGDLAVDTNVLKVDSSNNRVGIGTASPSQTLETAGNIFINTSGNPNLTVKTTGAGNNPFVRIQADTNYWDLQSLFSNTNDELDFRYNGTSTMITDKNGHISKPLQPMAALQPDTSSNVSISANAATHVVGWKVVGGRQTLIRGITLGASSITNHIANGNNTGRFTFTSGGVYYFDYTIRLENAPGSGNLYILFNGNTIHRMHVEEWNLNNFAHGRASRVMTVSANDYVEFCIACPTGGTFSGSGDTVNWLTIMKVA